MESSSDGAPKDTSQDAPQDTGDPCDYYVCQQNKVYGPADITSIASWIGEGRVTPRDWVFVPSICDWTPILEIPEMAGCFYSVTEKPSGPPPGVPVEVYVKYYKSQQKLLYAPEHLRLAERRKWIRMPLRTAMTFRVKKDFSAGDEPTYETYTGNISEGGLGFQWTDALEPGQVLGVGIDLFPDMITAEAQVVHCKRKFRETYLIGLAFRNLPDAERDKIRKFIRSCLHTAARSAAQEPPVLPQ